MKPERASNVLLGITRARAKMHEYGVRAEDYNQIPRSPTELFSLTIGMLGDVAASKLSRNAQSEGIAETRNHLLFCARFFDSYFESRLDSQLDPYMLLLAGATYYLAELPGSAMVIAGRIPSPCPDLGGSGLEELLSWLLKGSFQNQPALPRNTFFGAPQVGVLFSRFHMTGVQGENLTAAANRLRKSAYARGSGRQLLLADLIGAVVQTRQMNSTWATLPRYSEVGVDTWVPAFRKATFIKELWPAQHLLGDRGLYRGISAVVQMPTSAGKTRSLELIIRGAFYSGRTTLAIIVAPFRALCEEIRQSLLFAFEGEGVIVNALSEIPQDDFEVNALLQGQQVLVMTPEKCLYLLRHSPEITESLGLLIYDEGHQFDSGRRGVTYELLLTSLKAAVADTTQTVLVSAVLNNAQPIADWLLGAGGLVVSGSNLLPTSRALAFVSWLDPLGRLEFADPPDPEVGEFYLPRIIEQQRLNRLPRERVDRYFPLKESSAIGLYLALKLSPSGGVAVFVGNKRKAVSITEQAVDIFRRQVSLPSPAEYSDPIELQRLVRLNTANFGAEAISTRAAQLGIFAHHGNVPHGIRLAVEHAMKESLIRVVICTSTLAQGVNLPIKYLIVTGEQQGADRIKTRDFHNLMGRAGRSGMYTEGTVIFSDLQIFDGRTAEDERWRWPLTKALLDPSKSEDCKSSLLSVLDPFVSANRKHTVSFRISTLITMHTDGAAGRTRLARLILRQFPYRTHDEAGLVKQMKIKSDYLSAIEGFLMANWSPEEDAEGRRVQALAESTLAYHLGTSDQRVRLLELFSALAANIAANSLDVETRKVFSKSLFGLSDNVAIQEWVAQNSAALVACTNSVELIRLIWPLIGQYVYNNTFVRCIPQGPLLAFAESWLRGTSFGNLFTELVAAGCALTFGEDRTQQLSIDDVVEICENGLAYDGMLVVGAIAEILSNFTGDVVDTVARLRGLQKQLKYGLSSDFDIIIYELGFADRVIAQEVAQTLDTVSSRRVLFRRLRERQDQITEVLSRYPSYYATVFRNLTA